MIFTCHFIDRPKIPLMVGNITDNTVDVLNYKGDPIQVPRYFVSTPVATCDKCGQPVLLLKKKHSNKEYIECPDHARHMYDTLFAASHNMKDYNRKQRRQFHNEAGKWLSAWQTVYAKRTQKGTENSKSDD